MTVTSHIRKNYQLKYDNGLCSMNELLRAMNKDVEAGNNRAFHEVQMLLSMYTYKTTIGN